MQEPVAAEELLDAGWRDRAAGQDSCAYGFFEASLQAARAAGDRLGEARALAALSDQVFHACPDGAGNPFELRLRYGQQALVIFRELEDWEGASGALRILSSVSPGDQGSQMLEEALALARRSGSRKAKAAALAAIGRHAALRDRRRALDVQEQALAICRELGDEAGIANTLFSMALCYPENERRRACYEEAHELFLRAGRIKLAAQSLDCAASVGCGDEETELQEAYLRRAIPLYREIGNEILLAGGLQRLANLVRARGDEVQAAALEAESRSIHEPEPPDPEFEALFEELAAAAEAGDSSAVDAMQEVLSTRFFGGGSEEGTPESPSH